VLVFSPDSIVSVNILLDGKDIGVMHHVTGPLYVLKWDPAQYMGLHYITVVAKVQLQCVSNGLYIVFVG